eukprot:COSAG02_NODE_17474_length_1001_cov_0.821508_2_plen_91_part_00
MLDIPAWLQCWAAAPREQQLVCSSLRVTVVLSSAVYKDSCRAVIGCRAVFELLPRFQARARRDAPLILEQSACRACWRGLAAALRALLGV